MTKSKQKPRTKFFRIDFNFSNCPHHCTCDNIVHVPFIKNFPNGTHRQSILQEKILIQDGYFNLKSSIELKCKEITRSSIIPQPVQYHTNEKTAIESI